MIKKINFKKFSITIILSLVIVFSLTRLVWGWTNPAANPSSGAGAISVSSGNVGIGTNNPQTKLEVNGLLRVSTGMTSTDYIDFGWNYGGLRLYRSSPSRLRLDNMAINGSSAAFQLRVSKVSALDTTVMTALGDGNVGIATTTPWGLLSINPNGIIGPAFVIGSSTATHLIVTNGGEVGIGLTTPDANYKITTTGGGIKAENSSASQPAGYFSNAGGGPALMIGTGGFVTETRTSDPASPVTGQIWLRTDL